MDPDHIFLPAVQDLPEVLCENREECFECRIAGPHGQTLQGLFPACGAAQAAAACARQHVAKRRHQVGQFEPVRVVDRSRAAEAFAARRGNCVSFTNLFIAFGRALGIPLQAALIFRRARSEREGDLVMVYNHMVAVHPKGRYNTVYDFYMSRDDAAIELKLIDDIAVAAISASNRGVEALRAGDYEKARVLLERATKLDPTLPDLHSNLGIVRWRQGDTEAALEAFREGLRIDPHRPALLHNLAALYVDQGRTTEARAALAAANTREASAYLLVVQGDLEFAGGAMHEALKAYRRAHREEPKLYEALLGIARAERALGNDAAARRALQKALKLRPDDPLVRSLLEGA